MSRIAGAVFAFWAVGLMACAGNPVSGMPEIMLISVERPAPLEQDRLVKVTIAERYEPKQLPQGDGL